MSCRPVYIRITATGSAVGRAFDIVDNLGYYLADNMQIGSQSGLTSYGTLGGGMTFSVPNNAVSFNFTDTRQTATWSTCNLAYIYGDDFVPASSNTLSNTWEAQFNGVIYTRDDYTNKYLLVVHYSGTSSSMTMSSAFQMGLGTRILSVPAQDSNFSNVDVWMGDLTGDYATGSVTFTFNKNVQYKKATYMRVEVRPVIDGTTTARTISATYTAQTGITVLNRLPTQTITANNNDLLVGFSCNPQDINPYVVATNNGWGQNDSHQMQDANLSQLVQFRRVTTNGSQTYSCTYDGSGTVRYTGGLIRLYL